MASPVAGGAFNLIATEAVGVVGVVAVAGKAFGCGVEFVYAAMSRDNPQITMIVFLQILSGVAAYAPRIVAVVLVDQESDAVIAAEAVFGGKPHETPVILQNRKDMILRQAIVGGEVSESEV